MGTVFEHRCTACDYGFETSGLWEFYRDEDGRIQPYGHPVAASREARERGVYGLRGWVYCPTCDAVADVVLEEYKTPHKTPDLDSPSVWLTFPDFPERLDEYKTGELPACPTCGGRHLVLGDEPPVGLLCPRCRKGRLVAQATRVS